MNWKSRGAAASNSLGLIGFATIGLMLVSGCTPGAREDLGKAGDNVSSAVDKSAQGTATALEKAGDSAKTASKDAVADTKRDAGKAGDDLAVLAHDAGRATKEAAAPVLLTPRVREAIVADKRIKIDDLNVDTHADTKQVVVMGMAGSDTARQEAIHDAQKSLAEMKSEYKIADEIKVAKKPAMATK